jgi:hypothetical protein
VLDVAEQGHQGGKQSDIWAVRPTHDEWISHGWHWSYGFLRRRDLDDERGFCYEEPDGDFMWSKRREHHTAMFLEQWRDRETGKTYLIDHPATTRELVNLYGKARRQPKR